VTAGYSVNDPKIAYLILSFPRKRESRHAVILTTKILDPRLRGDDEYVTPDAFCLSPVAFTDVLRGHF
jgi:hypothetical protein